MYPKVAPGNTPATEESSELLRTQALALRVMLLTLMVGTPWVSFAIYLREGVSSLMLLSAVTSAGFIALWALQKRGHIQVMTSGLVLMLLVASSTAIVLSGTVRSVGVLIMISCVVLSSTFLSRRFTIGTGLYVAAALASFNWLEQKGFLTSQLPSSSWVLWSTQMLVLLSLLMTSLNGRRQLLQVVRDQESALLKTKKAESNLMISERRFIALFRSNPAATLVQHADSLEVFDVNDAFVRVFGYTGQDMLKTKPSRLWADAAERHRFQGAIIRDGRVDAFPATGKRIDGTTFAALVFGELVTHGEDSLIIVMVLDVSQQERALKAMEQSEERFSKAFNFNPLGMSITRLSDGRVLEANPANEAVLGYKPSDVLGTLAKEAPIWLTEADRQAYVKTLKKQGRLSGYETRLRSKSGEATDVKLWAEMIEIESVPCVLAFTMNVAEEKRREATLIKLAEGISPVAGKGFFLSQAENLSSAIGANSVLIAESTGSQIHTLAILSDGIQQPDTSINLHNTFHLRLLGQRDPLLVQIAPTPQEMEGLPPFESLEAKTVAGVVLKAADGGTIGLIVAVWTLTPPEIDTGLRALLAVFASRCSAELIRLRHDRELSRLYETLEQRVDARTAQLEHLNRELDSFAYSVSHDLKSPLRSIDGFIHILNEQMSDRMTADEAEMMARVSGSTARMGNLIADLLALARVSQSQLQRKKVDLTALAKRVIEQEQQRDAAHRVEVKIEADMVADCDPQMAHIVLENLLGNAWKYTRKTAAPVIEFGLVASQPGSVPSFYIQDNGAGFDMESVNRLFQPFTRLHSSKEFDGSGVGLATVRRILERHGGAIRAEGAVNKGARFEFSFGFDPGD